MNPGERARALATGGPHEEEGPSAGRFSPGEVRAIFEGLVPGYDWFNHLSSLGLDQRWRKSLARFIPPGSSVLDVGTGTGDLAIAAAEKARRVAAVDFSARMAQAAKRKIKDRPAITLQIAEAHRLPFRDGSFDVVTSSFVLRNLLRENVLLSSILECARVLRRGGRVLFLELTRPRDPLFEWGHRLYLKTALPLVGKTLFGRHWPADYLASSIEEFPNPEEIQRSIRSCGFDSIRFYPLSRAVAGLFFAIKP